LNRAGLRPEPLAMDRTDLLGSPHFRLPQWAIYVLILGSAAGLLSPILYYKYPLSADYLNHLARVKIIFASDDPFFTKIFGTQFGIIPNMGLDLLIIAFRPFHIEPNTFLKSVFVVSTAMMWLGMLECHRAVHRNLTVSALLLLPLFYSFVVALGFIDFILGIAIFMFVFAWMIRAAPPVYLRIAVVNLASTVVFFCHFGAFLIMLVTLFLFRLGNGSTIRRSFLESISENAVPIFLYMLMPPLSGGLLAFSTLAYKLLYVIMAFWAYSYPLSVIVTMAFGAFLAFIYKLNYLSIDKRWLPMLIGLAILAVIAPYSYHASYFIDTRLIWITLVFLIITIELQTSRFWIEPATVFLTTVIVATNVGGLAQATKQYNDDVSELERAIGVIPLHSFVFVSMDRGACAHAGSVRDSLLYNQIASIVTITRSSVEPYLFANEGTQRVSLPFYYREQFNKYFAYPPQGPIDGLTAALLASASRVPLIWKNRYLYNGSDLELRPFIEKWNERFSYVIHLTGGCSGATPYSGLFAQIGTGSFFRIFKTDADVDRTKASRDSSVPLSIRQNLR
jgi:hypothetical protein